ncbi:MAG: serine/threonine-protein kinase [Polyangiaceae bacterium]
MLPGAIGRYEVLAMLATGGMGEILLGRLTGPSGFKRAVVIKRLLRQYAKLPSFEKMFLDEARVIASIQHPNVIQVHELGHEGDELFLVMEYVPGESASGVQRRLVARGEALDPMLAAYVVAEAAAGLHAAHELLGDDGLPQNVVHRDVSPQNLVVTYDGHVKVLDFGIAQWGDKLAQTEAGHVKGKLDYMSPEQARGEPLDRRSDVFALGIVLYELLTSRRLFKRNGHARTVSAICDEPVLPPSRIEPKVPRAIEAVCLRALEKSADTRYATAAEMRHDLLEAARELASPADDLAALMRRAFADRIAEKEEMLRKVSEGAAITHVPAGETDDTVIVPNVAEAMAALADVSRAPVVARPDVGPGGAAVPEPPREPRTARVVIALLALSALASAAVVLVRRGVAAPVAPPASGSVVAAASTPAGPDPAPPPAPAPTPAHDPPDPEPPPSAAPATSVTVRLETRPAGASVVVAGKTRGKTPVDLPFPRGERAVKVVLRRAGHRALTQSVVPDRDQKLLLTLQPNVGAPAPKGSSSAGFRRFD